MPEPEQPDQIAHKLVTNVGSPARFHLEDEQLTVPTEPYQSGTPDTTTVPVASFDAVIEQASVEDAGLNVVSMTGIHLPASEWERVGLAAHQNHAAVDPHDPLTDIHRRLDLWATREDNVHSTDTDTEEISFDHLNTIPADSPLISEWQPYNDDDPGQPPVPLSYPTLSLYATHAEDADRDARGFDRIEVGTVARLEILDDLDEWPEEPDIEKRDLDLPSRSRHPSFSFGDLEPLPWDDNILEAVFTINRHAKRLDEEADAAYQRDEGATARAKSIQKQALYNAKTVAIHRLAKANPSQVKIARHELNGKAELFCLYFGERFSFHQPQEAVDEELLSALDVDPDGLDTKSIDFEPTADTKDTPQSLETALTTLADHGVNANTFLTATSVEDYQWGYHVSTEFSAIADQNE